MTGTLGVGDDDSRVYFLANGVLAAGAKPGTQNLYVAHEQEGKWTTTFIASPRDVAKGGPDEQPEPRVSRTGAGSPSPPAPR